MMLPSPGNQEQDEIWAANKQNLVILFWYKLRWEQNFTCLFYYLSTPMLLLHHPPPCPPSVHQLQLAGGERQDAANVVGDAQGQEGDDHQQQQDPPEAQILHKLLPGGPEAGQDALTALQVGVE